MRHRGGHGQPEGDLSTTCLNQTPPFGDVNLSRRGQPLLDALKAKASIREAEGLIAFGAAWGSAERLDIGRLANENPPKLRTHDPRKATRLDAVEFHPAYHVLMRASMEDGCMPRPGTSPEPVTPIWRARLGSIPRRASRAAISARSP